MSLTQDLQRKPIKSLEKLLRVGIVIVAIGLISFFIWQQKKRLSSLNISPSKEIPELEVPREELGHIKEYVEQLRELREQKYPISGIEGENLKKLREMDEKDLENLSEEDRKDLEELIEEIQGNIKKNITPQTKIK